MAIDFVLNINSDKHLHNGELEFFEKNVSKFKLLKKFLFSSL